MTLERNVEEWVKVLAEEQGGQAIKLTGYTGIPDRLLLLPGGVIAFVETKRPKGGVLAKVQSLWHKRLRAMGFKVFVPCTKQQAQQMFEDLRWK